MKKIPLIVKVLVALNLLVLGGWGIVKYMDSQAAARESEKIRKYHAKSLEAEGVMSAVAGERLQLIRKKVIATKQISNEDLDFCVATFEAGPQKSTQENDLLFALDVTSPLRYCRTWEAGQEGKVKALVASMVSKGNTEETSGYHIAAIALMTLTKLPDRNVYLVQLAKSPVEKVRAFANEALSGEKKKK